MNATIVMHPKVGFGMDLLHIEIKNPLDIHFVGTSITIYGCKQDDLSKAMNYFFFANKHPVETTK